nr:immunoglobulin light chain junction region [Macaca mulatta]MPO07251.1 immunoglobulin light chain junction region [Macaca mulatta]MPO14132.1 immunoglobulin light chain junction region [Macaca mulatta]
CATWDDSLRGYIF